MSRIGRKHIAVPAGVEVTINGGTVTVKGPKGTLTETFHSGISIKNEGGFIVVERPNDDKEYRALHGLTRTLIAIMVEGVTNGFSKTLEIVGVGYKAEKKGNKLVAVVRLTTETLSGIPSIVYGLFGSLFFVTYLKWSYSLAAGALTLAIMILPLVMRTTEEALKSVPDMYREGSFGLGAGKLRTVFCVVLPSAIPGILSGVILSIGRIVGETAALIYTAGSIPQIPSSIMGSGATLAVHMYNLSKEGLYTDQAYAVAVVLLLLVLLINWVSSRIGSVLCHSNSAE